MPFVAKMRAAPGALRRGFSALSLRARLVLGVVLLTAVGFAAADVIVYEQIHSYLINQVNDQLQSIAVAIRPALVGHADEVQGAPDGTWGAIIGAQGTSVGRPVCVVSCVDSGSGPVLPGDLVTRLADAPSPGLFFSAHASGNRSYIYEVFAQDSAFTLGAGGGGYVVAIPLSGVNGTLNRLILIDLGVSAVVLALLVALGYGVVRVSLRPLGAIEETAAAIGNGDLARRVDRDDDRTEFGRLGRALNAMLSQIEFAFGEQKASEGRLRQFLADASHELRTPVTSIRGYAELFRRGAASRPGDLELAMRRIEDEAVRMGVLVDDLLLLARLDQGRPLERQRVDLATIAIDAAADAQMLAPQRVITVIAPEEVIVDGDERRLHQVVMNYLENAMRYTPVSASIDLSVLARDGVAQLSVRDDGPGIAPEHAEHIFERFYRADPSRTRDSGGAGLGLSIVASIAEAHGGRAWVATAPGEGATFSVELPLAHSIGTEPRRPSVRPSALAPITADKSAPSNATP